jgi:isopentenyl diphosphate isomerase/L-lactate dehydrogenase-like FMN-dependent dehydrogenase
LTTGGAQGVKSLFGHLTSEIKSTMLLSGVAKTTDIRREHVVLNK